MELTGKHANMHAKRNKSKMLTKKWFNLKMKMLFFNKGLDKTIQIYYNMVHLERETCTACSGNKERMNEL